MKKFLLLLVLAASPLLAQPITTVVRPVTFDSLKATRLIPVDSIRFNGTATAVRGGAGNMKIQAGTGASRTLTIQTTTAGAGVVDAALFGSGAGGGSIQMGDNAGNCCGYSFVNATTTGFSTKDNGTSDTLVVYSNNTRVANISTGAVTGLVPLRGPAGAVGAPALSFSTATNYGFFMNGSSQMDAVAGGASVMGFGTSVLSPNKVFQAGIDGTVSVPFYSFGNSTNTGIYIVNNASTDTLALTANGTGMVKFVDMAATATGDVNLCWNSTSKIVRQGATCGSSTEKVKHGITTISNPVSKLMALRPVTYSYRPQFYGGRTEFGLIAEEASRVDTRLAFYAERTEKLPTGAVVQKGDPINVNDRSVIALLIATVQDQQRQLDSLKKALKKP